MGKKKPKRGRPKCRHALLNDEAATRRLEKFLRNRPDGPLNMAEVARRLGHSYANVRRALLRLKAAKVRRQAPHRTQDDRRRAVYADYMRPLPADKVAKRHGLKVSYVYRLVYMTKRYIREGKESWP